MDAINEPSPLGAELSRWLSALGAGIRAAAVAAPGDPAAPLAEEILESVDRWLAGTPVMDAPMEDMPLAVAAPAAQAIGWEGLIQQAGAKHEMPELDWGSLSLADGWEPFHLALLGLAPDRAAVLAQAAAALAVGQGAALDPMTAEAIPCEEDRVLVPGVT